MNKRVFASLFCVKLFYQYFLDIYLDNDDDDDKNKNNNNNVL